MSSLFNNVRLVSAINRLYSVVLIHIVEFLDNHVMGISMIVGKMIFNIAGGLSFVRSLGHMCLIL